MYRRTFVQLSTVGVATGSAGCGGMLGDSLKVTKIETEVRKKFENAVVRPTVENVSSEPESGTLHGEAHVEDHGTFSDSAEITVEPGDSTFVTFMFNFSNVDYENKWEGDAWVDE